MDQRFTIRDELSTATVSH